MVFCQTWYNEPESKQQLQGGCVSVRAAGDDKPATSKRPLRVIISGAPASGKGTQCESIVGEFGLTHISAGDLLRAAVKDNTEAGQKAKSFMDNGKLVPDEIIVTMITERLEQVLWSQSLKFL